MKSTLLFSGLAIAVAGVSSVEASTWTSPAVVSHSYGTDAGNPDIAVSPITHRPYVVYEVGWNPANANDRNIQFSRGVLNGRTVDWSATVNSAIDASPRGHKDGSGNMAVGSKNGQEQIHVTYWNHLATEDLLYVRSTDGGTTWSAPINLSESGKVWAGGATLAADDQGSVFVVYADWVGNANANGLDIWFRKFNGATNTWEARKKIENNPAAKSQNPRIVRDNTGALHVVWVDRVVVPRTMTYSVSTDGGASFSAPKVIFAADFNDDIGPAALAVESTSGTIYAVAKTVEYLQCCVPSALRLITKPTAGNWSNAETLAETAANPYLGADNAGHIFLSWLRLTGNGGDDIFVKNHNSMSWSCDQNTTKTNSWKGYTGGHLAVDPFSNLLYTATDDTPGGTNEHRVYVSMLDLLQPPLPVVNAAATFEDKSITITWKNPDEADLAAVRIVHRADRRPTSPTDGEVLDLPAVCRSGDSYVMTVDRIIPHNLAIYTRDDYGNYSQPILISHTPDSDNDSDVDQADFGRFQSCYSGSTVPQSDANCQWAKLDADDDVDLNDFALLQGCIGGPNLPMPPGCLGG